MKKSEKKTEKKLRKSYKRFYDKCVEKAKKISPNKKKISTVIKKARKIFERLHNIPRFDTLTNNICNFCDLISDYLDGIYTKLPLATIVVFIGGIVYLVSPLDVLSDFFPFIGWIDDAAVLASIVATEQNDVNEYLNWKKQQSSAETVITIEEE